MAKIKKRLTQDQEFQIMKLVLDKFLWIGMLMILYGVYNGVVLGQVVDGIAWGISGAIVWVVFAFLLIKEYEILA